MSRSTLRRCLDAQRAAEVSLYDLSQDAKLPTTKIRASDTVFTPRVSNLLDRACGRMVAATRSHGYVVGTPDQVAAHMAAWFEAGAADGFNIMPPYFRTELEPTRSFPSLAPRAVPDDYLISLQTGVAIGPVVTLKGAGSMQCPYFANIWSKLPSAFMSFRTLTTASAMAGSLKASASAWGS
jgi:hypothetical protein